MATEQERNEAAQIILSGFADAYVSRVLDLGRQLELPISNQPITYLDLPAGFFQVFKGRWNRVMRRTAKGRSQFVTAWDPAETPIDTVGDLLIWDVDEFRSKNRYVGEKRMKMLRLELFDLGVFMVGDSEARLRRDYPDEFRI